MQLRQHLKLFKIKLTDKINKYPKIKGYFQWVLGKFLFLYAACKILYDCLQCQSTDITQ